MVKSGNFTIPAMLKRSFQAYAERPSLVFAGEESRTYAELKVEIEFVSRLFYQNGIRKGDRVALLSTNMPNWGISALAVSFLGAIVVPILPDFSSIEIANIIQHSDSKVVIVSENLLTKVQFLSSDPERKLFPIEAITQQIIDIELVNDYEDYILTEKVQENDIASIIYTSGTSGHSKGVVLTHRNILWDAQQGYGIHPIDTHDRFLSILPLSHVYENTLGFFLPLLFGASVHYLHKLPTPSVLMPAIREVRPTIMLTVPLIMEKIYKKQIQPAINKNFVTSWLYSFSPVRKLINRLLGLKLKSAFGGRLKFFGIGGAKLDLVVEKFLKEARFPYSIGYGLTETSSLVACAGPLQTRVNTIGPVILGSKIHIHVAEGKVGEGEIWVQGPNVMQGYYKEPAMTREVLTTDGWLKTGDLGYIDQYGYLVFKGRLKSAIVNASGENIYPEEIETLLNSFRYIAESLVIERKGRLVALVRVDWEELEAQYQVLREQTIFYNAKIALLLDELKHSANASIGKFAQIHSIVQQEEPFERTPTQKIKRFLYS